MTSAPSRPAAAETGLFADDRRPALLLLAGCLLAWIPALPARDLWAPNEPTYGEVAREMLEGGDYLVPRLNGAVYPDKPPLYFWLAAGSARLIGGPSELALRLPSALAATALVLLTYGTGLRLFGRRPAFFAGAILATSYLFFEQATRAVMDPLFSLCVAAGMSVYLRARFRGGILRGAHFGLWWGLAILSKGYGLVLPALPAAAELFFRERRRWRAGVSLRAVIAAVVVAAGIAGAWFLPALGRGLTLRESVGEQVVGRVLSPWNHEQPPWYFLLHFPLDFLPWTPLLLLAIPSLRAAEGTDRDGIRFAAVWLVSTFVLFSAIPSKRAIYLMPALPAAALLLGRSVGRLCEGRVLAHGWARACAAYGPALLALGALFLLALPFLAPEVPEAPPLLLAIPGAGILATGVALRLAFRRGGFPAFFLVLPAGFAATGAAVLALLLPRLDPLKSPAPLAGEILRLHRERQASAPIDPRTGERLPVKALCYRVPPEGYRFYSGVPLEDAKGSEKFLETLGKDPPAIGVTTQGDYRALRPKLPAGIVPLARAAVGHREIVVLGARAP